DVFLEQRLFQPLGMTDTVFVVGLDRRDRLAAVYGPAPGGGLAPVAMEAVPFTTRPRLLEGAVGLVSTVPDFLRFSQMLLGRGALGATRVLPGAALQRHAWSWRWLCP
ncbi:MAG: serine hydrolase, partial [Chloroflexi bacterium]|nr:serine hydrolase [Chloroflexota bacterium]